MINIKIADQKFKFKNTWEEITIDEAIKLTAKPLPGTVQKLMIEGTEIKLSDFMQLEGLQYVRHIIQTLAKIPDEIAEQTHAGDFLNYFGTVLQMVLDLYNMSPLTFVPKVPDKFTYEGEDFIFPQSKVFNQVFMPATDLDAVSFVESANLLAAMDGLKTDGLKQMPVLIACYCKKPGEKFDQFVIMERAERFKELPMEVAWEVFFYMGHSLHLLMSDILESLRAVTESRKPQTLRSLVSAHFRRGYMRRSKRVMPTGIQLN